MRKVYETQTEKNMLEQLHTINRLPFENLSANDAKNCLSILQFKVKACSQMWHKQLGLECSMQEFKTKLTQWFKYLQEVASGN
jgi:hypothetical protein